MVLARPPRHRLTIGIKLESLTSFIKQDRWWYIAHFNAIMAQLLPALMKARLYHSVTYEHAILRVTSVRSRLLEDDNLTAKPWTDALVRYGVLKADRRDNTRTIVCQRKRMGKENEKTIIEIWPLDAPPDRSDEREKGAAE